MDAINTLNSKERAIELLKLALMMDGSFNIELNNGEIFAASMEDGSFEMANDTGVMRAHVKSGPVMREINFYQVRSVIDKASGISDGSKPLKAT